MRHRIKRHTGNAWPDPMGAVLVVATLVILLGTAGAVLARIITNQANGSAAPGHILLTALIPPLMITMAIILIGRRRPTAWPIGSQVPTDTFAGCLNRQSMLSTANTLIQKAHDRGQTTALVLFDVDHFKMINDFHGHGIGDRILEECASRISALTPLDGLVAHVGGDDFACVMAFDPHNPAPVEQLIARIIADFARPFALDGFDEEVTVSAGIARTDTPDPQHISPGDAQGLLHRADIALFEAKKSGRNHHLWFATCMESELRYRSELESGIRHGIAKGEFVPFYEQQVDLATGQLVGFEMLARWQSPVFGLVTPDVFIPIAEEIGLIAQLSEHLIAKAMRDAQEWDHRLTLSVNISPIQLRDPWFAQKLLRMLVASGFPANRLDIEITETCMHHNVSGVHALIISLKNQGIAISLDDFGTGYSSLAQLSTLPFDSIKIDRSFIANMGTNAGSMTIVETIAALGRGLGLPITAEGIETAQMLETLKALGPFKGQGYLYGQPLSAQATRTLLAQRDLLAQPPTDPHPAGKAGDDGTTALPSRRRA